MKNKVQLIGHLGQPPEVRETGEGRKVAHMHMATHETYRNARGDKITDTQWHSIIAWGRLAEIAERYLLKGMEVAVEGKLITRAFTDKQGVRRSVTEVQAHELLILTRKQEHA